MENPQLKCPSCGNTGYVISSANEPKSYDDLVGASCRNCGHKLTDEDIKRQTAEIAEEVIAKAFKRLGR